MGRSFFARDTRVVAQALLGRELIRNIGSKTIRGLIIETEAYHGLRDQASHAHRGKTKRTAPMFAKPGMLYIYLIYGMHWCLNISTVREGYPGAVLIRGLYVPETGRYIHGPGRVTRHLRLSGSLNAHDSIRSKKLTVGKNIIIHGNIKKLPRIGVDYAGAWSKKPWRYLLQLTQ